MLMRLVQLLALLSAFGVCRISGCDPLGNCATCLLDPRIQRAFNNRESIAAFLQHKTCDAWTALEFRFVAVEYRGDANCHEAIAVPDCRFAAALDLSIGEEIAEMTRNDAVTDMAREGQLECEPDGTLVFNRGRVEHAELDTLYQPTVFFPLAWSEEDLSIGFEVVLAGEETNVEEDPFCFIVDSVFVVMYDIVDSETGNSLVGASY